MELNKKMNKQNIMVIDAKNICYIAFHSVGDLADRDLETGVIFGFFLHLLKLAKKFQTNKFIFCWDSRRSFRKIIYPGYKDRKSTMTDEEKASFVRQEKLLRKKVIPGVGFKNTFLCSGYEADDLIAKVTMDLEKILPDHNVIIVSSDHDLFQLLNYAKIYNPRSKKQITKNWLKREWNIAPDQWASVKAYAGCTSDKVEGISGVAEKTAVKYITGATTNNILAKFNNIQAKKIYKRNLPLVKLPFDGPTPIKMQLDLEESLHPKDFIDWFDELSFYSFLAKFEEWRTNFTSHYQIGRTAQEIDKEYLKNTGMTSRQFDKENKR